MFYDREFWFLSKIKISTTKSPKKKLVRPVLRGDLWNKDVMSSLPYKTGDLLKEVQFI